MQKKHAQACFFIAEIRQIDHFICTKNCTTIIRNRHAIDENLTKNCQLPDSFDR